jgi:hypothetical protein
MKNSAKRSRESPNGKQSAKGDSSTIDDTTPFDYSSAGNILDTAPQSVNEVIGKRKVQKKGAH